MSCEYEVSQVWRNIIAENKFSMAIQKYEQKEFYSEYQGCEYIAKYQSISGVLILRYKI